MTFRLFESNGEDFTEFDDQATYAFNQAGILMVRSGDREIYYSPNGWSRLEQVLKTKSEPIGFVAAGSDS